MLGFRGSIARPEIFWKLSLGPGPKITRKKRLVDLTRCPRSLQKCRRTFSPLVLYKQLMWMFHLSHCPIDRGLWALEDIPLYKCFRPVSVLPKTVTQTSYKNTCLVNSDHTCSTTRKHWRCLRLRACLYIINHGMSRPPLSGCWQKIHYMIFRTRLFLKKRKRIH